MPAMHLINVDLPAPLSPTRAITSPSRTSKSTASSARTWPKLFDTALVSSVGVSTRAVGVSSVVVTWRLLGNGWGAAVAASPPAVDCLAVLLVRTDADLGLLEL